MTDLETKCADCEECVARYPGTPCPHVRKKQPSPFPDTQLTVEFNECLDHDIQLIQILDGAMNFAYSHFDEDEIKVALAWFNAKFGDKSND